MISIILKNTKKTAIKAVFAYLAGVTINSDPCCRIASSYILRTFNLSMLEGDRHAIYNIN